MAPAAALLIVSAFLHASWNALLKRERDPEVAVAGVLGAALAVALGAAALAPQPLFATSAAVAWGVGAGVFEGVYFVTLAAALARAPYGAVYAIARGGAMLVVWPASSLLLAEPVSPARVAGAAVIGVGLALVAAGGGHRTARRGGFPLAVACSAAIAGYHLCYDAALARGATEAPLFALALATALPFLLASLRMRGALAAASVPSRRALLRWALSGVLCTASFLLFLRGLTASGAALALTLRNTSVLFAQLLAIAMREPVGPRQVAGAALIAAGAALVSRGP